jgi:hypothetical protein
MRASIGALDGFDASESIWAAPTDSARTGTPITIIYAREKSADDAIEETAGALAGLWRVRLRLPGVPAIGTGARRM